MQQQVEENIYRKQNPTPPKKRQLPEDLFAYVFSCFFFTCIFVTKRKYSKIGGKYFLEDKNSEMYSMSVSIHHIYSSVALISL